MLKELVNELAIKFTDMYLDGLKDQKDLFGTSEYFKKYKTKVVDELLIKINSLGLNFYEAYVRADMIDYIYDAINDAFLIYDEDEFYELHDSEDDGINTFEEYLNQDRCSIASAKSKRDCGIRCWERELFQFLECRKFIMI